NDRLEIVNIVRAGAQDQNCDSSSSQVLLKRYIFVDCDEHIEGLLGRCQKLAVLFATETRFGCGLAIVTMRAQKSFDSARHTLVKHQLHRRLAARLLRASSKAVIAFSRVTVGKSSRNSSRVLPCSR